MNIMNYLLKSFSQKIWNVSFILFLCLTLFSFSWYASADDVQNGKNFFQDTDQDGLSNDEEKAFGTNPDVADSDSDGYSDGVEIEGGYDPLKPAPGDRIAPESLVLGVSDSTSEDGNAQNLTAITSSVVADLVEDVSTQTSGEQSLSPDEVSAALQEALNVSQEELILPEVDVDSIKVKKLPKSLKGEKRADRDKKDVVEYFTVMGYMLATNSPVQMLSENDFQKAVTQIASQSTDSITRGDLAYLDILEKQGKKLYEQMKDIEVPESILELHVNAMQLALYGGELKKELGASQADPVARVYAYGKIQAFMGEMQVFFERLTETESKYEIQNVSIGL